MSKSIINLFLVIVIVSVYIFLISPLQKGNGTLFGIDKSINELNAESNSLANTQSQALELINKEKEYQSDYEIITKKSFLNKETVEQSLLAIIPRSIDPVRLEEEVVRILSEKGFAVDSISYSQNSQPTSSSGSYTINFSTRGDYKRIKDLVNVFEISKRIYVIKAISFSGSSDKGDGDIPFQVKLETYYMN